MNGKPYFLRGWDESEPIASYVGVASIDIPIGYAGSITSVHFTNYHFIWCPKYRRKVIVPEVGSMLRDVIKGRYNKKWLGGIIALETIPDHVHLFTKTDHTIALNNIIARIEGRSSRILRNGFPSLKSRLPALWTRTYFVSTHGHTSSDTTEKYVEEQKSG